MARKLTEITVVYTGPEKFRREDFAISEAKLVASGEIREPIGIKGNWQPEELQYQQSYRLYGTWDGHFRGQKQFKFNTFVDAAPHGRGGITKYLQNCPNIGRALADALWEKFRGRAVDILREQPEVAAAAVDRLSDEKAAEASKWLKDNQALQNCTIELIDLLGGRGFPRRIAKEAIKTWGNRAGELIKKNPYLLQAFRGVGFKRCDAMYLDLGHPPARLKRQAYCAAYALKANTEGHTWHPVQEIEKELRKNVAASQMNAPAALMLSKRGKLIDTRRDGEGGLFLADYSKAASERLVAELIAEAVVEDTELHWPVEEIRSSEAVSDHQRENLLAAMAGIIGILGGSPGTGKTYSTAVVIKAIVQLFGIEHVAVAAPTGKAAVRLTEAMQSYGVGLSAVTIHRLLQVETHDGGGWSFVHDRDNPLPYRFIIVDETSMVDTSLMASLLSARAAGAHVLFVGDINQLPPVGHGAPLRDLILAGLPYGELREIRRNSGRIVKACAQMRDGEMFHTSPQIDLENGENLYVLPASNPAAQLNKLLAAIRAAEFAGNNPVWDCQVLVAVNQRSALSRAEVNKLLQQELNPAGRSVPGSPFRIGDKVVCLKNGFYPLDEIRTAGEVNALRDRFEENDPFAEGEIIDGIENILDMLGGVSPAPEKPNEEAKAFVANGELGEVVEVAEKITTVRLSNPTRIVKVPRGKGNENSGEGDDDSKTSTGCDWDLGYALSCHKSQGSDWPVVLVMIDEYPGARMVCSREWLYTAASRAKNLCFLVGKIMTAQSMCKRVALMHRKTFLVEQIAEAIELQRAEVALREKETDEIMEQEASGELYAEQEADSEAWI